MEESESSMPRGFRFYPTEEELVSFYLTNKLDGTRSDIDRVIPVIDVYNYDPWELPKLAGEYSREDEMSEQWFFFIPRREREVRGGRPNRLTSRGYWKATGSPGGVYSPDQNRVVGWKRTMVFYVGRAPYGKKTVWKMNEYKAIAASSDVISCSDAQTSFSSSFTGSGTNNVPQVLREELSVCRIYKKSKCVRSFDRRPPPDQAMVVRGRRTVAHHHPHQLSVNNGAATSTSHNQVLLSNISTLPNITTDNCSLDSSSSGDQMVVTNTNPGELSVENNIGELVQNYIATNSSSCEPSWDWEQIDYWFDL